MRILWIGFGQAGGKIANSLMKQRSRRFGALAVNTEQADLAGISKVNRSIVVGKYKQKGRGVGADLDLASEIAFKSLSQMVDEVERLNRLLDPEAIWIVAGLAGGTGAVSARVEQQIEIRSTVKDVDRWAGSDRYNTARVVAQNAKSAGWAEYGYVGVASGENYPDALAGGPVAGEAGGVMVLTQSRQLPSATSGFLSTNKLQIQQVQVYGGPVAISNAVIAQIDQVLK